MGIHFLFLLDISGGVASRFVEVKGMCIFTGGESRDTKSMDKSGVNWQWSDKDTGPLNISRMIEQITAVGVILNRIHNND